MRGGRSNSMSFIHEFDLYLTSSVEAAEAVLLPVEEEDHMGDERNQNQFTHKIAFYSRKK